MPILGTMSILVQILIILIILGTLYALVVHNREQSNKLLAILPSFKKSFPEPKSYPVNVVVFVPKTHLDSLHHAGQYAGPEGDGDKPAHYHTFSSETHQNMEKMINAVRQMHPNEEITISVRPLESIQ